MTLRQVRWVMVLFLLSTVGYGPDYNLDLMRRRDGGFLQAWNLGAENWRLNRDTPDAGFYPTQEAWEVYGPVGFADERAVSAVPAAEAIQASFEQQLSQFVQKEIGPRADLLQAQMVDNESRSRYGNRLGILYARYGLCEEARQEFLKVLEIGEEGFVLLNLGNVAFITGANEDALDLYRRAPALAGEDPAAQLALIHVFHELDDSESVEILLHELGWMAPDLVDQFNLFVTDHNDQGRSSGRGDRAGVVSWQAQQMSP